MDKSFGAIFQERDSRDYDLSRVASASPTPAVFRPDYSKVPVTYQGKQPACGSHSGATLEGILSLNRGESETDNSPRFLWKEIKDIDGYPVEVGTDLYSILKTLKDKGVCGMSLTGNDVGISMADYRNLKVTDEMLKDAETRRIAAYATIYSPTFQQIKDAIYRNGAIVIQYRCGQNMYLPSWTKCLPLSPDKYPMDSGHFVIGIGYDEKYTYFRNSWGTSWGVKGDGYFGEDYMPNVYAIGTAIDADRATPEVTKTKFLKDLRYGMTDPDVKALQKVLGVVQTGYFGILTLAAVKKYQRDHNIFPQAGFVGSITRSSLNS